MIEVEVFLFATLRRYHPHGGTGSEGLTLSVASNTTLSEIHEALGIPAEEIKMNYVNNLYQEQDYKVQAGDKIAIFPPIAGG